MLDFLGTGSDAVSYLEEGAAAVQVATRFTVTQECGFPDKVKQEYFKDAALYKGPIDTEALEFKAAPAVLAPAG